MIHIPHCSGQDCPHSVTKEVMVDNAIVKIKTIPCLHRMAPGEPAALWARAEYGICPHFEEVEE